MKSLFGLLLTIAFASASYAQDIRLGQPGYGGTGCPGGSVSVSLAPDQKSISMLFDQYVVQAGDGVSFDRKVCNIAIPVTVPQGYSVSVIGIDYRGFVGVPRGGRAQLAVNYFLADSPNSFRTTKTFTGPFTGDYLKSDSLGLAAQVWTACGAQTILRASTSMLVQTNRSSEQALATVDSADISAGLIYHLQWRRCN